MSSHKNRLDFSAWNPSRRLRLGVLVVPLMPVQRASIHAPAPLRERRPTTVHRLLSVEDVCAIQPTPRLPAMPPSDPSTQKSPYHHFARSWGTVQLAKDQKISISTTMYRSFHTYSTQVSAGVSSLMPSRIRAKMDALMALTAPKMVTKSVVAEKRL